MRMVASSILDSPTWTAALLSRKLYIYPKIVYEINTFQSRIENIWCICLPNINIWVSYQSEEGAWETLRKKERIKFMYCLHKNNEKKSISQRLFVQILWKSFLGLVMVLLFTLCIQCNGMNGYGKLIMIIHEMSVFVFVCVYAVQNSPLFHFLTVVSDIPCYNTNKT